MCSALAESCVFKQQLSCSCGVLLCSLVALQSGPCAPSALGPWLEGHFTVALLKLSTLVLCPFALLLACEPTFLTFSACAAVFFLQASKVSHSARSTEVLQILLHGKIGQKFVTHTCKTDVCHDFICTVQG